MRAALLLIACVSCGHSEIRWSLPPAMSPSKREAFSRSIERWNAIAIVQQSVGEGDRRVVLRDRSEMQNGCIANAETNGREIRLAPDADEAAMAHEIGHALGLGHIAGHGVMSAPAETAAPTESDREECRRVRACE